MKYFFLFLLPFLPILSQCDFSEPSQPIFSMPEWAPDQHPTPRNSLVIVTTSRWREELLPIFEDRSLVGGGGAFASYLDILKTRFPKSLLLLDSGNFLRKSSSLKSQKKIISFLQLMEFDGLALSKLELGHLNPNNSLKNVKNILKLPLISSNVIDIKTGKKLKRGILPHKIIKKNGVSVGIISTITYQSSDKELNQKLLGLYLIDPVLTILQTRKTLLDNGAQLIILMTNIESECLEKDPTTRKLFSDHSSFQLDCPAKDPLRMQISRLPENAIDIIIGNNPHFGSGFVGKVPVLQGPGKSDFFSSMELSLETKTGQIISNRSFINPPIKLCHKVNSDSMDCIVKKNKDKNKKTKLVPAKFLGMEIEKQEAIEKLIKGR